MRNASPGKMKWTFAGENYEVPVISLKARSLLSRHSDHCDHYDLSGFK